MTPEEMKQRSRGFDAEMSGEAVARRLDTVSRLRELGMALKSARLLGPVSTDDHAAHEAEPTGPAAESDPG